MRGFAETEGVAYSPTSTAPVLQVGQETHVSMKGYRIASHYVLPGSEAVGSSQINIEVIILSALLSIAVIIIALLILGIIIGKMKSKRLVLQLTLYSTISWVMFASHITEGSAIEQKFMKARKRSTLMRMLPTDC